MENPYGSVDKSLINRFFETQNINKEKLLNNEKEGKVFKNIKKVFSDAELLEVKKKD